MNLYIYGYGPPDDREWLIVDLGITLSYWAPRDEPGGKGRRIIPTMFDGFYARGRAMLNDPAVGGLRIDVDTFKGVVTLSGRVKSQGERNQAITIARGINGVVEVKDALQVIPENTP